MKKRTRTLKLVRETLGNLQDGYLQQIHGGSGTSVDCREGTFCECDTNACGGTASFCPTMTICSNC